MSLISVTAPANEIVTLTEVKTQCRIDGTDEDTHIENIIIPSARLSVETFLRRSLITQTWRLRLHEWPMAGVIRLPSPPLQSVTSVEYYDENGDEYTFASSNYIVDTDGGLIILKGSANWPTTKLLSSNGVKITYVAGYGDEANDVPVAIKQACLLMCGDLYENREAILIGQGISVMELPVAYERLLWPYRVDSQRWR